MIIGTLAFLALFGNSIFSARSNGPPVASFSYSPDIPTPSESIVFTASSSYDPDGYVVRYAWNFGDGNVTVMSLATVSHAYPVDGNYTVELTVTDNGGATGVASAVVEVSTEVYFRVVFYGTLIPLSNVQTTMYYKNGDSWITAPVGSSNLEIRYDNMTEPDLADTYAERFRNPGFTASILRKNASNIGFDIHPSCWEVYFKFQWGSFVAYWPNETTRVYTYNNGIVETKYYSYGHRAYWDATAGRYVIEGKDIPGSGVSPTQYHPIIVGVFCPPPPTKYYLTVRTSPTGVTTIPGEGLYSNGTSVPLTAPSYVDVSSNTRYRFTYWDMDGNSQGSGVNPISVLMTANHTATAHYVTQYLVTFNHIGLTSDAAGTVVSVDGSN
jgi:PKD repeat protein